MYVTNAAGCLFIFQKRGRSMNGLYLNKNDNKNDNKDNTP